MGDRPGKHALPAKATGLLKISVANATQIDRGVQSTRVGKVAPKRLEQILVSIEVVLGR